MCDVAYLLGSHVTSDFVVGKDGLEYLARDPLRDDKEPVKLSQLTAKVYAVRVIRRAE